MRVNLSLESGLGGECSPWGGGGWAKLVKILPVLVKILKILLVLVKILLVLVKILLVLVKILLVYNVMMLCVCLYTCRFRSRLSEG